MLPLPLPGQLSPLAISNVPNYAGLVMGANFPALIDYWKLDEASGTAAIDAVDTARNGLYVGSPALASVTGAGGTMRPAPTFDAVNDQVTFSAGALTSMTALFNPLEGTLAAWAKVSAASNWSDATQRSIIEIGVDVNNRILVFKISPNTIQFFFRSGGSQVLVSQVTSTLNWFHLAITWSQSTNKIRPYFNGVQVGADLAYPGVWAGTLTALWTQIGSLTSALLWNGALAHVALWNAALSAAQIAQIGLAR